MTWRERLDRLGHVRLRINQNTLLLSKQVAGRSNRSSIAGQSIASHAAAYDGCSSIGPGAGERACVGAPRSSSSGARCICRASGRLRRHLVHKCRDHRRLGPHSHPTDLRTASTGLPIGRSQIIGAPGRARSVRMRVRSRSWDDAVRAEMITRGRRWAASRSNRACVSPSNAPGDWGFDCTEHPDRIHRGVSTLGFASCEWAVAIGRSARFAGRSVQVPRRILRISVDPPSAARSHRCQILRRDARAGVVT